MIENFVYKMIRIGTLIKHISFVWWRRNGEKMVILQYKCGKKISSAKKYRIRNMKGRRITAEVFTGEISYDRWRILWIYTTIWRCQADASDPSGCAEP